MNSAELMACISRTTFRFSDRSSEKHNMHNHYIARLASKAHTLSAMVDFYVNCQSDVVGESPDNVIEFSYRHYPIRPRQIRSELLRFARMVHEQSPRVLVEIGTHAGGTFFVLCRCSHRDAAVVSIDLPGARFSGGYPRFSEQLLPRMPLSTQTFYCLRADSHQNSTLDRLRAILHERRVDVMLIDGDHTYQGVKQDFELYAPLVGKGGMIAFHDIVKHAPETGCEVDTFWREIKGKYKHEELVEDSSQGWAGIGVLHMS